MPERLINDDQVDFKLLGFYIYLLSNVEDGKHVIKSTKYILKQMGISKPTYLKYRNYLEKLGYISVSHDDFMMPSTITINSDNANFKSTDIDDFIDFNILREDATPQQIFRSLFHVDIPSIDIKRIDERNIPNHVIRLALMNVRNHESKFEYTDYSRLLNYAIKVAEDYQEHNVNNEHDMEVYSNTHFNDIFEK